LKKSSALKIRLQTLAVNRLDALSIIDREDRLGNRRPFVACFAGCSFQDVQTALGLAESADMRTLLEAVIRSYAKAAAAV
jgi:hypothetical protein